VEACLHLEVVGEMEVSSVVWEESQVRKQPIRILSVPPVEDLDLQLPRVSEQNKNTKCAVISIYLCDPICFSAVSRLWVNSVLTWRTSRGSRQYAWCVIWNFSFYVYGKWVGKPLKQTSRWKKCEEYLYGVGNSWPSTSLKLNTLSPCYWISASSLVGS